MVLYGRVVWDWKSVDYPELYALTVTEASEDADDFANEKTDAPDYVHFNSMRLDRDGNLVVSLRHMNTILCLDRTKQEDQILWKLSGAGDEFGLPDPQKTSGQHYVTVEDNTVTVLDNGNKNEYTRIQSYQLDIENKQAKLVRSYSFPEKFSQACGSVQHLGGAMFVIGWGWATTDAECLSVYDFSSGRELMSVTLDHPLNITYRCAYYE